MIFCWMMGCVMMGCDDGLCDDGLCDGLCDDGLCDDVCAHVYASPCELTNARGMRCCDQPGRGRDRLTDAQERKYVEDLAQATLVIALEEDHRTVVARACARARARVCVCVAHVTRFVAIVAWDRMKGVLTRIPLFPSPQAGKVLRAEAGRLPIVWPEVGHRKRRSSSVRGGSRAAKRRKPSVLTS